MSAKTEREDCRASINEVFQEKIVELADDEALRVVERMLGLSDMQISFDRAIQLMKLAAQYGIR
jgi:hypothetical protein